MICLVDDALQLTAHDLVVATDGFAEPVVSPDLDGDGEGEPGVDIDLDGVFVLFTNLSGRKRIKIAIARLVLVLAVCRISVMP